jgi:hypothetical protein
MDPLNSTDANDDSKLNCNLCVYAYPDMDKNDDPGGLFEILNEQPIVPQNIIFKIMDITEEKKIYPKLYLTRKMFQAFAPQRFKFKALINVSYKAPLIPEDAKKIYDQLIHHFPNLTETFQEITIDAEPVYDIRNNINILPFLTDFIKLINETIPGLPVSFYVSPAKFGNVSNGLVENAPVEYRLLIDALRGNPNNSIYLPAYSSVRSDDISFSVQALKEMNVPYRLIVDTRNPTALETRLRFIKENNLKGDNGLAIYPLESESGLQPNIMNLIVQSEKW